MATAVLNPAFQKVRGRMENLVHYNRMGIQCIRVYVKPRNPDTELQKKCRSAFADAVSSWKELTPGEKDLWNKKARRVKISGYNFYISQHIKGRITKSVMTGKESAAVSTASKSCVPAIPLRSYSADAPVMLPCSFNTRKMRLTGSSG